MIKKSLQSSAEESTLSSLDEKRRNRLRKLWKNVSFVDDYHSADQSPRRSQTQRGKFSSQMISEYFTCFDGARTERHVKFSSCLSNRFALFSESFFFFFLTFQFLTA